MKPGTLHSALSTLANQVNRWFLLLTALLLGGFLALAMWQLWLRPAAEVRMEGIALGPVQLSIHDLAAIFMIASLAVAVLTNTWPFFVFRGLWPSVVVLLPGDLPADVARDHRARAGGRGLRSRPRGDLH